MGPLESISTVKVRECCLNVWPTAQGLCLFTDRGIPIRVISTAIILWYNLEYSRFQRFEEWDEKVYMYSLFFSGKSKANLGWTPLHLAAYFGHGEVAKALLEVGLTSHKHSTVPFEVLLDRFTRMLVFISLCSGYTSFWGDTYTVCKWLRILCTKMWNCIPMKRKGNKCRIWEHFSDSAK